MSLHTVFIFFFFNDTATTEIYTLSLHDALPISHPQKDPRSQHPRSRQQEGEKSDGDGRGERLRDRKSTRLNSSHLVISYAVFCLKKKKKKIEALIKMTQVDLIHTRTAVVTLAPS